MIKKIIMFILVLSWMGLIFYFSSQDAQKSTNQSRAIINKTNIIDNSKTKEEKENEIVMVDSYFRKFAHAGVFFVLSILVCFLIKEYTLDIKKIIIISFIICFIYSCSDEIHQLYVYGRSAELKDVLIDNIGACFGYLIFYLSGYKIWKRVKND